MADHSLSERADVRASVSSPFPTVPGGVAAEILAACIRPGDAVCHLGAGRGDTSVALARLIGAGGTVLGVEADRESVARARDLQAAFAAGVGFDNVRFRRALATDLKTDLDVAERLLPAAGLDSLDALLAFEARRRALSSADPLIPDDGIDAVLADLSAVAERADDAPAVLAEISRILKPGGRCVLAGAVLEMETAEDAAAEQALSGLVESAGLEGVRIAFRAETLIDVGEGMGLRPILLTAVKPVRCADPAGSVDAITKDMGFSDALRASLQGWSGAAVLSGATATGVAALAASAQLTIVEPDGDRLGRATATLDPGRSRSVRGALGDFRTDPARADAVLADLRPHDLTAVSVARHAIAAQAAADPLLGADSRDLVVLDLAVNRRYPDEIAATLAESFRVLRKGGRLVMTVLLADEPVSCEPPLVLGELTLHTLPLETEIVAALDRVGFHGMGYIWCNDAEPVALGAVEVRAFLIAAFKGKQGPCLEQGHAVIYRGPFSETWDDDGHHFVRGERTAVCSKTYGVLMRAPYKGLFIGLPSRAAPPLAEASPYDCGTPRLRDPRVTKGLKALEAAADGSAPGAGCC